MSSLPPSAIAERTDGSLSPGDLSTRPEHTLTEVERLLGQADESEFRQAAVAFAVSITEARFGFLYQQEGEYLEAKVIVARDPQDAAFTAQQQVDLIATAAVAKNTSQRATVSLGNGKCALLCVPFTITGQTPSALALLLGPERAPFLEPSFTVLHLATQLFIRRSFGEQTLRLQHGFNQATSLVDLFARVAQAHEFREAVAMICDEMHELTGCARVAIGIGDQHRCKIYGISGAGKLGNTSQATSQLASIMRESIGVDSALIWPERHDLRGPLTSANHNPLLETMGMGEAICLPLKPEHSGMTSGEAIGAIAFLFSADAPARAEHFELMDASAPHLSALVHLSSESLPRGWRGAHRRFRHTASRFKKTATVALPLLALAAMFLPVPYRIPADCRLQPEITRQVAAPFDGLLEEALVKPGNAVKAGQLLAILDGKEIRWRLAEAIARREAALKERDQAMAKRDVAAAQLAQLEADGLALQVELLGYQRDNLEIRAPIDGVIISGNLERSQGVPVMTGQKLFDIAPIDQLEVEISVPDAEIAHVEAGQTVNFRLESQARFRYEGILEEIYPISDVQEEKNIFVCLSTVENPDAELRPGMLGKARISADPKMLGWVLFHRLWDWFRLHLW